MNIEGNTLAKRYTFLLDDAEDISYRMYDLFIRRHPKLKSLFSDSREFHILLFIALIDCPATFKSNSYSIHEGAYEGITQMINHPHLIKHPDVLSLNRPCLINAIQDVLFDEAHPQLISECSGVYDEMCTKMQPSRIATKPSILITQNRK